MKTVIIRIDEEGDELSIEIDFSPECGDVTDKLGILEFAKACILETTDREYQRKKYLEK